MRFRRDRNMRLSSETCGATKLERGGADKRLLRRLALAVAGAIAFTCGGPTPPTAKAAVPLARGYHHMFSGADGVLLFGGDTAPPLGGGYVLGDLWVYRVGRGWIERKGIGHKDGLLDGYRTKNGELLSLVDSKEKYEPIEETWLYNPQVDTWQQQPSNQRPNIVNGSVMAYDAESDRMIVFTGETWSYNIDANTWQQMMPAKSPVFGAFGGFVYDERSDRVVYMGGHGRGNLTDVWNYDFNQDTWTEVTAAQGPGARDYPALAYDRRSGRIFLFGGLGGQMYGDTWAYDAKANTWTELHPSASPVPRARHAMAFDLATGTIVMFGGSAGALPLEPGGQHRNDTWIYDPEKNNWAPGQ